MAQNPLDFEPANTLKMHKEQRKVEEEAAPEQAGQLNFEHRIELKPLPSEMVACRMVVSISYVQLDDRAQVDTNVENEDCAASSGQYTVRLQVKNASSETHVIEHIALWQRDDDAAVAAQTFYDIGDNVDLIRVSTAKATCACDQPRQVQDTAVANDNIEPHE